MKQPPVKRRLPLYWTSEERVALFALGLWPWIPPGQALPSESANPLDPSSGTRPWIGDPENDLPRFCLWLGIPHALWENREWRWCIQLRYRWADKAPLDLIDEVGRRILERAVRDGRRQDSIEPFLAALAEWRDRPDCFQLIAVEYADARMHGAIGRRHALRCPFSGPEFWSLIAARYPATPGGTDLLRYVDTREGGAEHLLGRIIHDLHCFEARGKDNAFLFNGGSAGDRPPAPDGSPVDDLLKIVRCYHSQLGIPYEASYDIVEAWGKSRVHEPPALPAIRDRTIVTAAIALEKMHPELYQEYRDRVKRFRSDTLMPRLQRLGESRWDLMLNSTKLRPFFAALADDPLFAIAFEREVWRGPRGRQVRKRRGRPAEPDRGFTCACAVQRLRTSYPIDRHQPISEVLPPSLPLSRHVRASIVAKDNEHARDVYGLAAPLLAALFHNYITPAQIKVMAQRYKTPDMNRLSSVGLLPRNAD